MGRGGGEVLARPGPLGEGGHPAGVGRRMEGLGVKMVNLLNMLPLNKIGDRA